jgi:hypothetical protein
MFTRKRIHCLAGRATSQQSDKAGLKMVVAPLCQVVLNDLPNGYSMDFSYATQPNTCFKRVTVEKVDDSLNKLRLTELDVASGTRRVSEYTYQPQSNTWELRTGDGERIESKSTAFNQNRTERTSTRQVRGADGQTVSLIVEKHRKYPWGWSRVEKTEGSGPTARTTRWTYYENATDRNNYAKLKETIEPEGRWERRVYDSHARVIRLVQQLGNEPLGSPEDRNRVTEKVFEDQGMKVTIAEKVLGREVSRQYRLFGKNTRREIQCAVPGAAIDDPSNAMTVTEYEPGIYPPAPRRVEQTDGTMAFYQYNTSGAVKTVTSGQPNAGKTGVLNGTQTLTVRGTRGDLLSEETKTIVNGNAGLTIRREEMENDLLGRPVKIQHLDGTQVVRSYDCCGLASETDGEGVATDYVYDSLKRLQAVHKDGITTMHRYDAAGRKLATIRQGTDGSQIVQHQAVYDLAGQLQSEIKQSVASFEYNDLGQLAAERYTAGPLAGLTVANAYDLLGRRIALEASHDSHITLQSFTYDDASRLQTVTEGDDTASYS